MKYYYFVTVLFAIATLCLAGTAPVHAGLSYTGVYAGNQVVPQGASYRSGFDFWYPNSTHNVKTAPGLSLARDARGALGTYTAGDLQVTFLAQGQPSQSVVTLYALDQPGYTGSYPLSLPILHAIDDPGWARVAATDNENQPFTLKGVSITDLRSAPMPTSALLLACGLIGLLAVRRRTKRVSGHLSGKAGRVNP